MKEKGSEASSSSLVIVSRKMLIAGFAGISLFSFGLGYFFGYGGNSATKMVKQVAADNKILASEERTVLDSSGKPTMAAPQVIPGAIPKAPPLKPGLEEGTKPLLNTSEGTEKQKKSPGMPVPEKSSESVLKKDAGESEKKTEKKPETEPKIGINDKLHKERVRSVAEAKKPEGPRLLKKPTAKRARGNSRKVYALQVGAFEDPQKAARLKKDLSAKGYTVSITAISPESGRTFSRVRLGPYATKREAEDAQSKLKGQGMEGVVYPSVKYQQ